MSDIWNEKNTVCWSPTKFIKEMNKLQALNAELEAELAALREAVLAAMRCYAVDGYVNWERVAALLGDKE